MLHSLPIRIGIHILLWDRIANFPQNEDLNSKTFADPHIKITLQAVFMTIVDHYLYMHNTFKEIYNLTPIVSICILKTLVHKYVRPNIPSV